MIKFAIFAVFCFACFYSLLSAYRFRQSNIRTFSKGSTPAAFGRPIYLSQRNDSPIDETPEYLAELDRLQKLKSNEFLQVIESSDISLKGLNDRKELERVLALENVLRRKAFTSSPRLLAQELHKELALLQSMSISSLRQSLRKSLVEFPENATEHELRVLLARSNIKQARRNQRKINIVTPTNTVTSINVPESSSEIAEEIYFNELLNNAEEALGSVSNGIVAGMNTIRNLTDSISSTTAEKDALKRFAAEPRSPTMSDIDKRAEDWLKEVAGLATFDEIMSWCATKPRRVIIDVLRELKVPVGRYMTYSAACTSLADHLMTVRHEESAASNGADDHFKLDKSKMSSKLRKKVVGDFAFERDIWRRIAKQAVPNTIVGTTNFIGEMLTLIVTSIKSIFTFHVAGGNHPLTWLEKLVQLLSTAMAALGNALGLWAGSGRLSSRSVISLAVMYTIYQRKGLGGFLNAIMVTKLFTSFFNSLGIPAIIQKATTAKIKQINTHREEEEEDWSDNAFGSS